jgi:hypothetical protein
MTAASSLPRTGRMPAVIRRTIDGGRYLRAWMRLLYGAALHALTGKTPKSAHLALVDLFIASAGRANDVAARFLSRLYPPYHLPPANGVLGALAEADLRMIEDRLERDGYVVFEKCLSVEFCERLVQHSLSIDCQLMGDEMTGSGATITFGRYDRQNPQAAKYLIPENDATDIAEVQELIADTSLIAVAQNYLKAKPIFSGISLWWSPSLKDTPDAEAAQEFHWDMERIRWLRYFIYLTDVSLDSGPHCFVEGTHRTGSIPKHLRDLGYTRHSDESMLETYGKAACREFVGGRGTIIAEDSRGFHKGALPKSGDRLLLAFELSSSTFGANKRHLIRNIRVPQFRDYAKKYPRLYANFDFAPGTLDAPP